MFMNEMNYPPSIPKQVRSILLAYAGKDLPLVVDACDVFKKAIDLIQDFLTELNSLEAKQSQLKQWISQKAPAGSSNSFFLFGNTTNKSPSEIYL